MTTPASLGVATRPWARRVRRWLLAAIGILYLASIPWYRGEGPTGRLLGLPDWVGVAVLCYAAVAVLNAAAWLLTDVRDPVGEDRDEAP